LIPEGLLVTDPAPVPALFTVSLKLGAIWDCVEVMDVPQPQRMDRGARLQRIARCFRVQENLDVGIIHQ
jgi:hypothetical protein